jgi:hypothetical protein
MAVAIKGTTAFEVGVAGPLFTARMLPGGAGFRQQYDVTPDGQRFLLNVPVEESGDFSPMTVVVNWTAGLKK